MRRLSSLFLLLFTVLAGGQNNKFTVEELLKVQRVADPQVSPDGKWVAFVVMKVDLEKNSRDSDIWLVPISGGAPRQVTFSPKSDDTPRWSPDSRYLAFVSNRDGSSQVWILDVQAALARKATGAAVGVQEGKEGEKVAEAGERKLTQIGTEAAGVLWSPDGKHLAFVSDVYPECSDLECNDRKAKEQAESPVKAKIADALLYRHWNFWKDGKRTHLLVVPAEGGTPRDLTPGPFDAPPFSLGGPTDYDFSPDGEELAFVRNSDKDQALSTNHDLWVVSVQGGQPRRITSNPAADASPRYSPDGRYIAYRAQRRAGFESDRWRLMLYDRKSGQSRSPTEAMDRWVGGFAWAPDSGTLYFAAEDRGRSPILAVPVAGGSVRTVVAEGTHDDVRVSADGRALVFVRHSLTRPSEIYRADPDGRNAVALTRINEAFMASFGLRPAQSVEWKAKDGSPVQGFVIHPPDFDPSRKYPFILFVHGGPQGAWDDAFSYRWNPQVFASHGYVGLLANPRGSTGFGQKFIDEISADWGGKVYDDLMRGVDHLIGLGYIDPARMAAAGGSYGGYMANWIQGHTDRFKALISHAGVYNLVSMYGATEELWFPEWEFRGTPWTNPEMYDRWSPHRFVHRFRTPMLVIHGELDYRVPVTEGLQLFTALQRKGVPSRLLYFPDEGHWILKPRNSQLWYQTFLSWLERYVK